MPVVGKSTRRQVKAALAVWAQFENKAYWKRSTKGSLWRKWDGVTVSIFNRDRRYRWSIADEEGVMYSHETYGDESDAMTALGEALGLNDLL